MGNRVVITLIRHGLTTYNEEKRYLGATDLPLSMRGKAALKPIDVCWDHRLFLSSDLRRCMETAELLFPGISIHPLSTLREMNFGEWEGKTYADLKHDPAYCKWLDDPASVTPPCGESTHQFERRVESALSQILSLLEESNVAHAVVVTHGGVIRQLLTQYAPVKKKFFEWHVPISCAFTLSGELTEVRRGLRFTSLQEEPITEKTNG